jgi:hypothetical protein
MLYLLSGMTLGGGCRGSSAELLIDFAGPATLAQLTYKIGTRAAAS